jgi:hypothetical protein
MFSACNRDNFALNTKGKEFSEVAAEVDAVIETNSDQTVEVKAAALEKVEGVTEVEIMDRDISFKMNGILMVIGDSFFDENEEMDLTIPPYLINR